MVWKRRFKGGTLLIIAQRSQIFTEHLYFYAQASTYKKIGIETKNKMHVVSFSNLNIRIPISRVGNYHYLF